MLEFAGDSRRIPLHSKARLLCTNESFDNQRCCYNSKRRCNITAKLVSRSTLRGSRTSPRLADAHFSLCVPVSAVSSSIAASHFASLLHSPAPVASDNSVAIDAGASAARRPVTAGSRARALYPVASTIR